MHSNKKTCFLEVVFHKLNCHRKHQFMFHVKFLSKYNYVTIPVEFLCYWKHDSLVEIYFNVPLEFLCSCNSTSKPGKDLEIRHNYPFVYW